MQPPPLRTRDATKDHGDGQAGSDYQPFERPGVLVGVDTENDLDPISPHDCDHRERQGATRKGSLEAQEDSSNSPRHSSPFLLHLMAIILWKSAIIHNGTLPHARATLLTVNRYRSCWKHMLLYLELLSFFRQGIRALLADNIQIATG